MDGWVGMARPRRENLNAADAGAAAAAFFSVELEVDTGFFEGEEITPNLRAADAELSDGGRD